MSYTRTPYPKLPSIVATKRPVSQWDEARHTVEKCRSLFSQLKQVAGASETSLEPWIQEKLEMFNLIASLFLYGPKDQDGNRHQYLQPQQCTFLIDAMCKDIEQLAAEVANENRNDQNMQDAGKKSTSKNDEGEGSTVQTRNDTRASIEVQLSRINNQLNMQIWQVYGKW